MWQISPWLLQRYDSYLHFAVMCTVMHMHLSFQPPLHHPPLALCSPLPHSLSHFLSHSICHSLSLPVTLLQDAVSLYDAIATRVAQPRLTEVELRLWLAAQGCCSSEAGRVLKLLRNLVLSDPDAPCFSAWEWAAGWTWVQHAFEVYGVPITA